MGNKNSMIKIVSLSLMIMLILSSFRITVYANINEPSSWAFEEIEAAKAINAVTENLMNDYKGDLTRGEFIELLVKTYEAVVDEVIDIATVKNPFEDTDKVHIIKAYTVGIANGISATVFSPESLVTREQMIVMIMRMVEQVEIKRNVNILEAIEVPDAYSDQDAISNWATESILRATANKVISGTGNRRIEPKSYSTKEQAIVMNYRLLMRIVETNKISIMWNINLANYKEDTEAILNRDLGEYEESEDKGFVVADILNMRSVPDTADDETIIRRLKAYEEVVILEDLGDWYKIVATNEEIGYVYKDYIHKYNQDSAVDDIRIQMIAYAKQYIGTPYSYAGNSLTNGIDCSGFTRQILRPYGYILSRSSSGQWGNGIAISEAELLPGDLVFYGYSGSISHVALYAGDGKIIHATTSSGVRVTAMRGYMRKPLIGYRRVMF